MKKLTLTLTAALLVFPSAAKAATIYTTFDDLCTPGGSTLCTAGGFTYRAGVGWTINPFSGLNDAAMAFTPTGDYTLDALQIVLLGPSVGTHFANVQLMSDAGGLPGTVLESFQVVLPGSSFDPATVNTGNVLLAMPVVINSTLHPLLASGAQYWLSAGTDPNGSGMWVMSGVLPTGLNGSVGPAAALRDDGTWVSAAVNPANGSTLGSFAVEGTPAAVPEPATLLLLGSGIGVLARRGVRPRRRSTT